MKIKTHNIDQLEIAEVISEENIITSVDNGGDFVASMYFSGYDKVILHQNNICDEFFDLKTKLAGEILQKFTNFRVRLVIIGNFEAFNSKSLNDFIYESNNGSQVNFLDNLGAALASLSR